jgi:hypothetical protein
LIDVRCHVHESLMDQSQMAEGSGLPPTRRLKSREQLCAYGCSQSFYSFRRDGEP